MGNNTSNQAGYLLPVAPNPLQGVGLQNFLQEVLVGITGMDGKLVRPRWQSEPPDIPIAGTVWCAFGITSRIKDTFAFTKHVPGNADVGTDVLQRQEELHITASFYDLGSEGQADQYAELLADGFQIAQNREVLQSQGFAFVNSGDLTPMPVLLKERWQYRVDVELVIRRQIDRIYNVLNLESAQIEIDTDISGGIQKKWDAVTQTWDEPDLTWDETGKLTISIDVEPNP
jgi:hypothetical protein